MLKEDNQIKRLRMIQYLSIAMNQTQDPDELLGLMLDKAIELTKATTGSIMLKEEGSKFLRYAAYRGFDENKIKRVPIAVGEGLTGAVFKDGIPRLVNDVDQDPLYIPLRDDIQSELIVPLQVEGQIIGVLSVDSVEKNAFSEEDLELLYTISNQAAQILYRTRLYEELKYKIHLQEILIEISQLIEKKIDLQDIFDSVMNILGERIHIDRGMLVLFEPEQSDKLSIFAGYRLTSEECERGIYRVGEGIIGGVVATGEPQSIPNIHEESRFLNRLKIKRDKEKPISFIAVPLKLEGLTLGVLAIEKEYDNKTYLKDLESMLFLVGQILSNKVRLARTFQQEKASLLEENLTLKKELEKNYTFHHIVGKNAKMRAVFELIHTVADTNASVLILGESGTGKELVARALHYNSSRKDKPFVSINCASIPENLLESELFGYKKGAFTGANTDKKGLFLVANGGTLFLDEIGDMPFALQAHLLRALQEREISPLGSETKIPIDVRIVAATNKVLKNLVKEKKFREDLYYRLNVIEIQLPPLRERKDDIPLLVRHFIQKVAQRENRSQVEISEEALIALMNYSWPGNVRELENSIERAFILAQGRRIELHHIAPFLTTEEEQRIFSLSEWIKSFLENAAYNGQVYEKVIGEVERELIHQALLINDRNKVKTADFLGINRNTLRTKIDQYHIT
ncbi:sigma 54-interacting transcriptional regulator [Thermospira aquatica]|uniref:Sigma 54-interacting transcriptional regulator n=1 Tax=Thermospira aquatica TaxID=2828656 RepID=A0AAX3BD04_9SPIR|nr:sigma 54-interacting transcriptional regulator [Thermospira aquatica]URA09796.1 sigma 54-interacting transcriptional regulator [Thermospira aquatica]